MNELAFNDDGSLNVPDPVPYAQQLKERNASQEGLNRDQIKDQLTNQSEYVFDPDTAVPPDHHWVERGLVMSCEGANHPNHRHFKVGRK